jgi:hypothetical protein
LRDKKNASKCVLGGASTEKVSNRTSKLLTASGPPYNHFSAPAADARPAPADNAGESDYAYFVARPHIDSRIRFPFENEYPPCVLAPGRSAFVRILITRDATGQPKRARRVLRFCKGGRA